MSLSFCVMRAQPFHNGHAELVVKMLRCDEAAVFLAACQDYRTHKNPWTFAERKVMIEQAIGPVIPQGRKLSIFPLVDISDPEHWAEYVVHELLTHFYDEQPTEYYCGEMENGKYFNGICDVINTKRIDGSISGTELREALGKCGEDISEIVHALGPWVPADSIGTARDGWLEYLKYNGRREK